MPLRKTPAPSNAQAPFPGPDVMEAINTEVTGLWQYVQVPLSDVAGTANAITANCDVALDQNRKGQKFTLTPTAANTGAATLNVNDRGALPIINRDGSVLSAGRLIAGRMETVENDGAAFRLLQDKPPTTSGASRAIFAYQMPAGTAGQNSINGWSRYPLNTQVLNEIAGLVFDGVAQQLTLPAGTYDLMASAYFGQYTGVLVPWNVSDNQMLAGIARVVSNNYTFLQCAGKITLAATKIIELRVAANAVASLGPPLNATSPAIPEQYGFLDIRSIA